MEKKIQNFKLGRTCRFCREDIEAVLMEDEDGYYVCETCGCAEQGLKPRLNSYDVVDYMGELNKRINADRAAVDVIAKYTS